METIDWVEVERIVDLPLGDVGVYYCHVKENDKWYYNIGFSKKQADWLRLAAKDVLDRASLFPERPKNASP